MAQAEKASGVAAGVWGRRVHTRISPPLTQEVRAGAGSYSAGLVISVPRRERCLLGVYGPASWSSSPSSSWLPPARRARCASACCTPRAVPPRTPGPRRSAAPSWRPRSSTARRARCRWPAPARPGWQSSAAPKLTIVPADTRGDPNRGADEAARLVDEERAVGLVGAYDTDVTEVASQRSERLRAPFVNGDTSADYLTERGLDWFFRVGPTDRMYGEAFFSTLSQAAGRNARKVAVLASNTRPSSLIAAQIQELADGGGCQLVPGACGRHGGGWLSSGLHNGHSRPVSVMSQP